MQPAFIFTRPQPPEERAVSIAEARELLANADRVLIGAGAGLSTAAGLTYDGPRFQENFRSFIDRYGITDMYSAGFYPFPTAEDKWAYWSHHATVNCIMSDATELYRNLYEWAKTRDYFVVTTNVDLQFEKAGFDSQRIFEPQGTYDTIQCCTGEHGIKNARELFAKIEQDTNNGERTHITDASLVPTCEVCGQPMEMHLRVDGTFVQDDAWYAARDRFNQFVAEIPEKPTLLLELGVGWNTPVWIRMPFENIARETGSPLVRMNYDEAAVDKSLPKAIAIEGDIAETFPAITH